MSRLFTCLLLLFMIFPLFSQEKARIEIFLPENQTESGEYDVVAETIQDTVALSLYLLNRYEVNVNQSVAAFLSEEEMKGYCLEHRLDNLLFGRIFLDEGFIVSELSVFDAHDGQISLVKQQRTESLLGIFASTDRLVADMIDALSGSHVGYGELAINNNGLSQSYSVYINDFYAGDDLVSMVNVVAGDYTVTITQKRLGTETVIHRQDISITEGGIVYVDFAVPDITPEEKSFIRAQKEALIYYAKRDKELAERFFSDIMQRFDNSVVTDGLEAEKNTLIAAYEAALSGPPVKEPAEEKQNPLYFFYNPGGYIFTGQEIGLGVPLAGDFYMEFDLSMLYGIWFDNMEKSRSLIMGESWAPYLMFLYVSPDERGFVAGGGLGGYVAVSGVADVQYDLVDDLGTVYPANTLGSAKVFSYGLLASLYGGYRFGFGPFFAEIGGLGYLAVQLPLRERYWVYDQGQYLFSPDTRPWEFNFAPNIRISAGIKF